MSVKIDSKEKLDANAYNRIIIREVDSNFFVKVVGEKPNDEYIQTSYKLSNGFRKKSDYEKIVLIVENFLVNTQISCMETEVVRPGCKGIFIKISGARELYLQIVNKDLINTLIKMAKNKYEQDRYSYCIDNSDNKSYAIRFSCNSSSYESRLVICDNCVGCEEVNNACPKYIEFKLMYNGKMLPFEMKFMERFIYDRLWEVGLDAQVVASFKDIKLGDGTLVSKVIDGYSIICGDVLIKFNCSVSCNNYIVDFCNKIVNRYNNELKDIEIVKKRQLKMEGF